MTAALAFLLDALIGDPRSKWHPVAVIGRFIAVLEKFLYREKANDGQKFCCGLFLTVTVAFLAYFAARLMTWATQDTFNLPLIAAVQVFLLWFTISPKSLASAGGEIYDALTVGNLPLARQKVGYIVGRDTEGLDEGEITRATVETIAENTTDGIIAPLFFFFVGGVPLAVMYRAANTMDSMIGYKNDKYLFFGRAAARLDDVLNFIPARITGLLTIIAAFIS